jgi:hypothetical protein
MTLLLALLMTTGWQDPDDPVSGLIRRLGDDDPQAREQAQRELQERGSKVEGDLRRALEGCADAEARSRIEAILRVLRRGRLRELCRMKRSDPGFMAGLAEIASHFQPIEPLCNESGGSYTRVTLNMEGAGLDAIRFRTPPGRSSWKMVWEFVRPSDRSHIEWYIVACEGKTSGFETFTSSTDHHEEGQDLPRHNVRILQSTRVGSAGEYVLWFAFRGDAPVEMNIRIRLLPWR